VARRADLLSVEEARARIFAHFDGLESEDIAIGDALGRVLAEPVTSAIELPPFANSSMDGFALQSSSTAAARPADPVLLRVTQNIPAGTFSARAVAESECARIMTGAPLPPGADAVVPFEEVEDRGEEILLSSTISRGSSVRPAGQDVGKGASILSAGSELNSRHIGLLAALGVETVAVSRRPVVAILSTGDELAPPGADLQPGQIYNSNAPMLAAAVIEAGAVPRVLPTSGDDPESLTEAIRGASGSDVLLTSGGASVGDFDYVKDVVGRGGELNFWRVRIRPGKPLLFGLVGNLRVIGLPGNPTSAMVTFEEFARPAIRRMLGASLFRPMIQVRLDDRIDNRGGRRTYARARIYYDSNEFHATLSGPQDSAMLVPLAHADGLVIVPEEREELEVGELAWMQIWRLPELSG
jgi:molybdopterin molybdotransferase